MRAARGRALAFVLAVFALGAPSRAGAGEQVDVCADAAERAQTLRAELHYGAAREQLRTCARPTCPRVVHEDCTRWLEELSEAQPTVLVVARDEHGAELADVRVLIDDAPVATRLEGRELPVDPGARRIRLEASGRAPLESTFIVHEREKGRVLEYKLKPPGLVAAPEKNDAASNGAGPLVHVTAGVGVVAAVAWASLGIAGIVRHGSLAGSCAKTSSCDPDDVDTARGLLVASDIAGGVALVAAALFAVELIVHHQRQASPAGASRAAPGTFHF